jgi:hypothetical protein
MRVVLPTPGGPTTPTMIGGASSGRRSTRGTWRRFSLTCSCQYRAWWWEVGDVHRASAQLSSATALVSQRQKLSDSVLQNAASSLLSSDVDDCLGPPCSRFFTRDIARLEKVRAIVVRNVSNSGNALHELRGSQNFQTLVSSANRDAVIDKTRGFPSGGA